MRRWTAGAAVALAGLLLPSSPARAALGYEPAGSGAVIPLQGELPHGLAIDQASQRIYVAESTANVETQAPGQVEQLESTGTPTAASPFTIPGQALISGVAVDPLSQGIYAAEFEITTPVSVGNSAIHFLSSAGAAGPAFNIGNTPGTPVQIATDSSGRVFFPSDVANSVQIFNASGTLLQAITCGACPGGSFLRPVSVAIDSADTLYVVDIGLDMVLVFAKVGGSYTFDSVLQSDRSAAAVGVDPSDNTVFVGGLSNEQGYHVIAYDSSGVQFDDFGGNLFGSPPFGLVSAGQIAVNATTHKVYVSDPNSQEIRVFEKVTINPPAATTDPASSIGQITARLNATVNPRFHALIDCYFEYTDQVEFEANGFANASNRPCSSMPGGSSPTPVFAQLSTLEPDTTYRFRVVAANNAGTATGGSRTFTTMPLASPTVTTGAAGAIAQTTATLSGKVNPHGGKVTDCHFEYGPDLSYGFSAPCSQTVEPVTTDVTQSRKLTGLTPATTYHYQLVVTSNAGTAQSSDKEFTTLPLVPAVTTGAATGIGETVATVSGTIDPNGAASSCQFEYGTTTAYGAAVPCASDPGAGDDPVAQQVELSGLVPSATYHYRLAGTNAGGTAKGLDATFTTQSPPPPVIPTSTPPLPTVPPEATPPKPLKCKKGFRKKKVRGKLRCVKKKKPKRRRR